MVYHQNQLDLYPHKEEVERSYFFKFEFRVDLDLEVDLEV